MVSKPGEKLIGIIWKRSKYDLCFSLYWHNNSSMINIFYRKCSSRLCYVVYWPMPMAFTFKGLIAIWIALFSVLKGKVVNKQLL